MASEACTACINRSRIYHSVFITHLPARDWEQMQNPGPQDCLKDWNRVLDPDHAELLSIVLGTHGHWVLPAFAMAVVPDYGCLLLPRKDSSRIIDTTADVRSSVEEILQQQDDSSQSSGMPQRIGLDSEKHVLLPLSFSPFMPARWARLPFRVSGS